MPPGAAPSAGERRGANSLGSTRTGPGGKKTPPCTCQPRVHFPFCRFAEASLEIFIFKLLLSRGGIAARMENVYS